MNSSFSFFQKTSSDKKSLLTLIFLFSLSISLVFLVFFGKIGPAQHRAPGTDYLNCYLPIAKNIFYGEFIHFKENLTICASPGYPIILVGILSLSRLSGISELDLIILFNLIVSALSACLLFLIAESIFNKEIALLASFLWLSYPFNVWFVKNPNTEVPFILLLYLGIWLYILALKNKKIVTVFFSGFVLSFSILVRPIGILLIPLFALAIFFLLKRETVKRKFIFATIFFCGAVVVLFPWEFYLFLKTNHFILLSSSGAPSIVDGLTFALVPGEGGDQLLLSDDIMALMRRAAEGSLTNLSKVFYFLLNELKNNPSSLIKLIGWKVIRSWYGTSQMWWEREILAFQLFYLLTAFLGIVYALWRFRTRLSWIIFLLIIVADFWLMTISALSILRYMVPVMGLLIIFSAVLGNFLLDIKQ